MLKFWRWSMWTSTSAKKCYCTCVIGLFLLTNWGHDPNMILGHCNAETYPVLIPGHHIIYEISIFLIILIFQTPAVLCLAKQDLHTYLPTFCYCSMWSACCVLYFKCVYKASGTKWRSKWFSMNLEQYSLSIGTGTDPCFRYRDSQEWQQSSPQSPKPYSLSHALCKSKKIFSQCLTLSCDDVPSN